MAEIGNKQTKLAKFASVSTIDHDLGRLAKLLTAEVGLGFLGVVILSRDTYNY